MRKGFLSILTLYLSFVLCGCTEKASGSNKDFIFAEGQFPPDVSAFVQIDEQKYKMENGNYEWHKGSTTIMTDAASPRQIAEEYDPITISPGEKLTVKIEQDPEIIVNNLNEDIPIENPQDNQFEAPVHPGKYIYETIAKWENGEVSFTFVVEVKP